jgi:hypothetical protein
MQIPCVKVINNNNNNNNNDNNNNSKMINVKLQTLIMANNSTCSRNCNYRISATLYTLKTWFALGT